MPRAKEAKIAITIVASLAFAAGFGLGTLRPTGSKPAEQPDLAADEIRHQTPISGATTWRDGRNTHVPDDIELGTGKYWFPGDYWVILEKTDDGWYRFSVTDSGGLDITGLLDPEGYRHGAWNYMPTDFDLGYVAYFWHGIKVGEGDVGLMEWTRRDHQEGR